MFNHKYGIASSKHKKKSQTVSEVDALLKLREPMLTASLHQDSEPGCAVWNDAYLAMNLDARKL
jgi:hypothetical protein